MKKYFVLVIVAGTFAPWAIATNSQNFDCHAAEAPLAAGGKAEVRLQGTLLRREEVSFHLNYQTSIVFYDEDQTYRTFAVSAGEETEDERYRPKKAKYRDFIRFKLPVNGETVEYLFPKKPTDSKSFTAYLRLNHFQDWASGTVALECR